MGNTVGSQPADAAGAAGKVVLSDGRVQNLVEPTTVAELMLEHPQHVVVEFDPSSISFNNRHRKNGNVVKKKLAPLPADKTLEPGKIYLMLPAKRCGAKTSSASVTASEEVRRMLLTTTAVFKSSLSYYEGILPWFTRVYPAAAGGRDVAAAEKTSASAAVLGRLTAEEEMMRPEYLSRQLSGKGWKPSLDTIKEKKVKKKIHQWLSF